MPTPNDARSTDAARQHIGLAWPRAGRWRWVRDGHLQAAAWAALPVGLALWAWGDASMRPVLTWIDGLLLVVLRPVIEEFVFRGLLQGWLAQHVRGNRAAPITMANAVTTAAFVAAHAVTQPLPWALATVVPSLVLGHLRERHGSVLPCIAVHSLYNAAFAVAAELAVPR